MPIEVGLWRLGDKLSRVEYSAIESESRLEQTLANDISIIDHGFLLIGRQVLTKFGKFVDLLALDANGNVVVIELKKNRTPREVVAQLLDYGSWVRSLEDEEIASIFETFEKTRGRSSRSLDEAFCEKFGVQELPDSLNESHVLVLVAAELDVSTERIITYLAEEHGVSINAVFFRFFRDGDREYMIRAWLHDPVEVEAKVEAKRIRGPWNGEYYVSYGHGLGRNWEDARKYGFVSAGGGPWYSRTLSLLEPEGRVWVNLPGTGYVGVGIVESQAVPIDEFRVNDGSGKMVPIASLPLGAHYHREDGKADPDKTEYFVRVRWLKTLPVEEAIREKGFFGNQNSAAQPRSAKWQHTVERLKQRFGLRD